MSIQKRYCCCNWVNCEIYQGIILEKADGEHEWKGPSIRIHFSERNPLKMTDKKIALFKSINRHLWNNEHKTIMPSNIYIHPHHFPIAYLSWRKKLDKVKEYSTPLSLKEAKEITKIDQRNRFSEYTNCMFNLHNSLMSKMQHQRPALDDNKFKNIFIQSPFSLLTEVQLFTRSCNSKRRFTPINIESNNPNSLMTICTDDSKVQVPDNASAIQSANDIMIVDKPIRSNSPSIVPQVDELKCMLIDKFCHVEGNLDTFRTKKSVVEIAKILAKYHEYSKCFQLEPYKIWFYPCLHYKCLKQSWQCKYFSLHKRNYDRVLSCEPCTQDINNKSRKKRRRIEQPSRSRPIEKMTETDMKSTIVILKHKKKGATEIFKNC